MHPGRLLRRAVALGDQAVIRIEPGSPRSFGSIAAPGPSPARGPPESVTTNGAIVHRGRASAAAAPRLDPGHSSPRDHPRWLLPLLTARLKPRKITAIRTRHFVWNSSLRNPGSVMSRRQLKETEGLRDRAHTKYYAAKVHELRRS